MKDKLWYGGGMAHYSDLSMIVLGLIVERITGMPLDVFASNEIFEPVCNLLELYILCQHAHY
jgi:CubicO group peptidase (beta-lactamase class C family)